MPKNNWCVYCHTLLKDGRKYVGITSNKPKCRWHRGLGYVNNQYFYRTIKKYGWEAFEHTILYSNLSKEEAEEIEMKLIKEWQTQDKRKGFNIREGGNASLNNKETRKKISIANKGRKVSDETKKKISVANSGSNNGNYGKHYTEEEKLKLGCRGENHWLYGKHLTNETKTKISNSLKGKPTWSKGKRFTKEHCDNLSKARKRLLVGNRNAKSKPIVQYDMLGNYIKKYQSMRIASMETSINYSCIKDCANGKQHTAGNYKWELVNE